MGRRGLAGFLLLRQITVLTCFLTASVICCAAAAQAQVAGLDLPGNWEKREVYWRDAAGLPVDHEFAAPLVAQYNWAYGMTVVGVNVRGVGSNDHYAAVGLHNAGYLDIMAVIGPLTGPVIWDAGPFHVAAGMPDGRLVVWLTTPGEYPRELQFSNAYEPGTAFDVTVYTPDQANTAWNEWWVSAAFQLSGGEPAVTVQNQDGQGNSMGDFGLINIPGDLESVAYLDYPVSGISMPLMLLSVKRDEIRQQGNNEHLLTQAAYYEEGNGWYVQTLRNSGIENGAVYTGYTDSAQLLVAYDESDEYSLTSSLQQVGLTDDQAPSAGLVLGGFDHLSFTAESGLWEYFPSTRTSLPMAVASDGADLYLGYYSPAAGRIGNELGYIFTLLVQGEVSRINNQNVPVYPKVGVTGTSHWSTGDPELFWVQKGSENHGGGQLYRLQFIPSQR